MVEVEPEPEEPDEEFYAARTTLMKIERRVSVEVDGAMVTLHTLYDWWSTVTLVRKEAARRTGRRPLWAPRRAVKRLKARW